MKNCRECQCFSTAIIYNSVALLIKQYDKTSSTASEIIPVMASSAGMNYNQHTNRNQGSYQRPSPSRAEHDALKMKHPCHIFGNFQHLVREHNDDCSLSLHFKILDNNHTPSLNDQLTITEVSKITVKFNMASLVFSSASTDNKSVTNKEQLVPLFDDGAPYSAIGMLLLTILCEQHKTNQPI